MTCTFYTLEMLREAKEAEFRISTGQNVVIVIDQNGERLEYQKANLSALQNLIRKMEIELRACGLLNDAGIAHYRPLGVYF